MRARTRKLTSLATALIVLIMLFGLVPLLPQPAQAAPDPWWDANWQYRMLINITEKSGSTLTNYQVPITLTTTTFNYSKTKANGDDIRFATDGTQCDYWIETWNASGQSKLWVEVPSLPASSTTTIYMYYGNSGASAVSNGNNTFQFFDDFPGTSLDTSKWSGATANASVSGSVLTLTATAADRKIFSTPAGNFGPGIRIRSMEQYPEADGTGDHDGEVGVRTDDAWIDNVRIYYYSLDILDKTHWICNTYKNGSASPLLNSTVAVSTTWHTFERLWRVDSAKFYIDTTYLGEITANVSVTAIPAYVRAYAGSGNTTNTKVDWIFIAQYVSPEPTVNLGQEESSTSWMDYFGGTAAISSLTNVTVSGGDVKFDLGFIAYRSNTSTNLLNSPKSREWDGSAWGSESELPTAGSPVRFSRVAYCPTAARSYEKIVVTLSDDGYLDAYVWTGSSWAVTNNIAQVWTTAPTGTQRPYDITYETSSGRALLVYDVVIADATKDLGYKIWTFGTGWSGEYYINVTGVASTNPAIYFVNLASNPDTTSNQIAMVIQDDTNADTFAGIWNGSSWGLFTTLSTAYTTVGREATAIAYSTYHKKILAVSGNGANSMVWKWYVQGAGDWSTGTAFDPDTDAGDDVRFITLKPDPAGNSTHDYIMCAGVNDLADLNAWAWNMGEATPSRYNAVNEVDEGVDTFAQRCIDFAWEPTDNKGLIVWGTEAGKIEYNTYSISAGWGASWTTSVAMDGTVPHLWVQLRTNPRSVTGGVKILGAVLSGTSLDLGAISWNGTTFTVIGSSTFTADTTVTTYECFEMEFSTASSGNLTSVAIAPSSLQNWGNFTANHTIPSGTNISYQVLNASNNATLCTITATQALAGYNISSCAGSNSSIKLYAELSTTGSNTPTLHDWKVTWSVVVPGAPTVDAVTFTPSSITPQVEQTATVTVSYAGGKADLATLVLKVYYDSDGGTPTDAEAEAQTANTQNCAIVTWTQSTDTFAIEPSASTTWSLGNCSSPASLPGDFTFKFTPGKVATETTGSAVWQIWAKVTDDASQTDTNYDTTPPTMNWYGEINVNTVEVNFGTVYLGSDFSDNQQTGINITYIANGNYSQQVKASSPWGAAPNATLNASGEPGDGEFSLKANDDATLGTAVLVSSTAYTTFDSGTQTAESGNVESANTLWLKLGASGIPYATYNGTIYYQIAPP